VADPARRIATGAGATVGRTGAARTARTARVMLRRGATARKRPAQSCNTPVTIGGRHLRPLARRRARPRFLQAGGLLRNLYRPTSNLTNLHLHLNLHQTILFLLLRASACAFTLKIRHAGTSDLGSSLCSVTSLLPGPPPSWAAQKPSGAGGDGDSAAIPRQGLAYIACRIQTLSELSCLL
jgi:hypothetical protein